jgi:hypothetical protein
MYNALVELIEVDFQLHALPSAWTLFGKYAICWCVQLQIYFYELICVVDLFLPLLSGQIYWPEICI